MLKYLLLVASSVAAFCPVPVPAPHHSSGIACPGNTPDDRGSWCQYDLNTDWYTTVPYTGVTREYFFEVEDVMVAPDGIPRPAYAINGQIPGPTIEADWGDEVVVHVKNNMIESKNGTTIHFHGIRQYENNPNDGVASITQCPLTPGNTMTYKWRATQYGTTWYHAHLGVQAWDGVLGGIQINGPATANYDEDKGVIIINDWGHVTADSQWDLAQTEGSPNLKNALINGQNIYVNPDNGNMTTGHRFNTSFTAGASYRLRLVNSAINSQFTFSIDNHTLTVISNDLVPIVPFNTTQLSIGIAERYDVIVTADQGHVADSFWMRATPLMWCSSIVSTDIKGIVYYGEEPTEPTTTGWPFVDNCLDVPTTELVPYLAQDVGRPTWVEQANVSKGMDSEDYIKWYINNSTLQVSWKDPILLQVYEGANEFRQSDNLIELPEANKYAYVVIEQTNSTPHPIHLHGHDFQILSQGHGPFNASNVQLINPTRRDTAMLPAAGHLAIAFLTNNPGVWLLHCHIGWHASEGFSLTFLERENDMKRLYEYSDYWTLKDSCDSWAEYEKMNDVYEVDSGI
ncbi:Cupredoxin [Penicillium sp. IBT 16267x]|nr:Cupredoxin [Penicillium sp. IBT 16267x]